MPPSTSPASAAFRARTYWRGPVWLFLNLLLGSACARDGQTELYETLRSESLQQLSDVKFGEYCEPFTGEALGSLAQAWTAAAALEWLGGGAPEPSLVSLDAIREAASAGNPRVTSVLDAAADVLGRALAATVTTTNPDRLVLGGKIGAITGLVKRVKPESCATSPTASQTA